MREARWRMVIGEDKNNRREVEHEKEVSENQHGDGGIWVGLGL